MAERLVNGYKRLFEIRALHHYWLDEGATVFDLNGDIAERDQRLLTYDINIFMTLEPTPSTAGILKGMRCTFKRTRLGGVVVAPHGISFPPDAVLEFIISIHHPFFFNYTALTIAPQKTTAFISTTDDKQYRFKENVPVLSNLTGASRMMDGVKRLFLSKEFPTLTAEDLVESLVLVDRVALFQLTSDQPNATRQQMALAHTMPVFLHQGDVPAISPPAGVTDAPTRGILLTENIPDNVYALVQLSAIRADDNAFSFVDANGQAKTDHPIFEIRFNNRSTVWKYFNKRTGALVSSEPEPLPLTYFGNAGTKRKPSVDSVKVIQDSSIPPKVIQLISEIFD